MVETIRAAARSGMRYKAHEAVNDVMDRAQSVRDSGEEAMARMTEKATAVKTQVDGYIRENPEKSVLIAAGVGAVVGALLAAAIMRRKD